MTRTTPDLETERSSIIPLLDGQSNLEKTSLNTNRVLSDLPSVNKSGCCYSSLPDLSLSRPLIKPCLSNETSRFSLSSSRVCGYGEPQESLYKVESEPAFFCPYCLSPRDIKKDQECDAKYFF